MEHEMETKMDGIGWQSSGQKLLAKVLGVHDPSVVCRRVIVRKHW